MANGNSKLRTGLGWAFASLWLGGACAAGDPTTRRVSRAAITAADCPPGSNIIEGTAGDDVIRGTNRADSLISSGSAEGSRHPGTLCATVRK